MNQSIRLGVNIDHVATLREVRGTEYPSPLEAARIVETQGGDGLTLHLREDRRHIQEYDVKTIREQISIPMNLEMAATETMLNFAEKIKPAHCCLVPEKREELTTEGGLDVSKQIGYLKEVCHRLTHAGIIVSLFIDAEKKQIDAAKECGVSVIELHTGIYADAKTIACQKEALQNLINAANYASKNGLTVNAGHGLHYQNVQAIAAIPNIHELNIGHSIIAKAIFIGLGNAVREMKKLLKKQPPITLESKVVI